MSFSNCRICSDKFLRKMAGYGICRACRAHARMQIEVHQDLRCELVVPSDLVSIPKFFQMRFDWYAKSWWLDDPAAIAKLYSALTEDALVYDCKKGIVKYRFRPGEPIVVPEDDWIARYRDCHGMPVMSIKELALNVNAGYLDAETAKALYAVVAPKRPAAQCPHGIAATKKLSCFRCAQAAVFADINLRATALIEHQLPC